MRYIDINCDMGENKGDDAAVIKYICSANIACGGHAGDADTMKRTMELALENGVKTGAHPGYSDPENFGRIETSAATSEIIHDVMGQLMEFGDIARSLGTDMSHIKFHGALYNRAAADYELMLHLSKVIFSEIGNIPVFTLAGSVSQKAVTDAGGSYLSEGFADRAYDDDGCLVPRKISGAVINDPELISRRVLDMASGNIMSIYGKVLQMEIDTICVHGDTPGAVRIAEAVYNVLSGDKHEI